MADGASSKPLGRLRGRPFERGRSGNPAARRSGSRNKTTEAAADIATAMKAVTSALADGAIMPGGPGMRFNY